MKQLKICSESILKHQLEVFNYKLFFFNYTLYLLLVKLKDDSRSSSKKRKESNMDIEQSSSKLGPIVKRPRAEISML